MKIRNNGNWEYRKLRKMKIQKMQIWKIAIREKWKSAKVKIKKYENLEKRKQDISKNYICGIMKLEKIQVGISKEKSSKWEIMKRSYTENGYWEKE